MIAVTCSLRLGIVYIPTLAKVFEGFYEHVDPVAVIPVTDGTALEEGLLSALARGNPLAPQGQRAARVTPILKYTRFKTQSELYKKLRSWSISQDDGLFEVIPWKPVKPRGLGVDKATIRKFPRGTTAEEVCRGIVEILQTAPPE